MSKKQFSELELQFQEECKVINLKYEYDGYNGDIRWAIISNLTEDEMLEKYRPIISDYMPFIVLPPAFGEVRDEYRRNEKKHYMRSIRGHIYPLDEELEKYHPEIAVDDSIKRVLTNDQNERLWEGINSLEKKQRNRLISYFIYGRTFREIAKLEGVDHKAIVRSVGSALKKLKKFLK